MATRWSPYARVKMLSIATLARDGTDEGQTEIDAFLAAFQQLTDEVSAAAPGAAQAAYFKKLFESVFRDVGIAERVGIDEDYGSRSVFGIGQPTEPALIPNNMTVRVNISRLTADARSIADYALKPSFWYDPALQRSAINSVIGDLGSGAESINSDMVFHTYLAVSDIERGGALSNISSYDSIQDYQLIQFIPRTFSKSYQAQNSVIMTDVSGEGKVLRLRDLISAMTGQLAGGNI